MEVKLPRWIRRLLGRPYWAAVSRIERAGRWLFRLRIALKWRLDAIRLPLCREHRSLYQLVHAYYYGRLGRFPRVVHCSDYNDKIQWLKLFDQDERMIRCSDKLGVREYVHERVGSNYLLQVYQVCNRYEEIDFQTLPQSFVIKTNHDGGTVFPVRDKSQLNHALVQDRVTKALKRPFGWEKGEWAYAFVHPQVFVEEYIDPTIPSPPADYKFHCANGRVCAMQYIYDRGGDTRELFFDREGKELPVRVYFPLGDQARYRHPPAWNEMRDVAEALAADFKYVRVDLFLTSTGRIAVGEMTFWPMGGCYTVDEQRALGDCLDFDRSTFKPPICQKLIREGALPVPFREAIAGATHKVML